MEYGAAYRAQCEHLEEVLVARQAGRPEVGRILTVEHDPVITVSSRAAASGHLLAGPEMLRRAGVAVQTTDRGGDITYHGPGQLVVYPILDLNLLNLGLHDYMRLLEEAVIDACGSFGLRARREPGATGVWVGEPGSKICAMGVRVRRWICMHGLALNVAPDMSHFGLIVPCGLVGRGVTSLRQQLDPPPSMDRAKAMVVAALNRRLADALQRAELARATTCPASSRSEPAR
jgi:lipoate-protein ligase B